MPPTLWTIKQDTDCLSVEGGDVSFYLRTPSLNRHEESRHAMTGKPGRAPPSDCLFPERQEDRRGQPGFPVSSSVHEDVDMDLRTIHKSHGAHNLSSFSTVEKSGGWAR
jgi:hypothetical protein